MNARRLTLCDGTSAVIDDRDWQRVIRRHWRTHPRGIISETGPRHRRSYALLHRLIVRARPGEVVVPVNGDFRDCRRSNLRLMTKGEHNRQYVQWRPRAGRFCGGWRWVNHHVRDRVYRYCMATFRGRKKYFRDEYAAQEWLQAARARDSVRPVAAIAAEALYGGRADVEHAVLSFEDYAQMNGRVAAYAG